MANNKQWQYFYDAQIRRYLVQFMRIFSFVKIQSPPDDNGNIVESSVPIRYGDMSRMVATILSGNSENTILSSNQFAVTINSINIDPGRRNNPHHTNSVRVQEREYLDGAYTKNAGNAYSIDRHMPVPYELILDLHVWTNTTTTKFQILEQIMTVFNPDIQLQTSTNVVDWSSFFNVELTNIDWTSRSQPVGTSDDIDIATLQFKLGIWINPPALVTQQKIIEEIVVNVANTPDLPEMNRDDFDLVRSCFDDVSQIIITPGNHQAKIGIDSVGVNEIMLLNKYGAEEPEQSWEELIGLYGELDEGNSFITLKGDSDIESTDGDVIGLISYHPTDKNKLVFDIDIDSLPATIMNIDMLVDPTDKYPGNGLPAAAGGQRYVLLDNIASNTGSNPWGTTNAKANDIIEYDGSEWKIIFNSEYEEHGQSVKSLTSYQHFTFTENGWVQTYFGQYQPGYFRLALKNCSSNNC